MFELSKKKNMKDTKINAFGSLHLLIFNFQFDKEDEQ